jgi:hypothetical protein
MSMANWPTASTYSIATKALAALAAVTAAAGAAAAKFNELKALVTDNKEHGVGISYVIPSSLA